MSKPIDLTGEKFGRLLVQERAENSREGRAQWLCKCDCGKLKVISGKSLREGKTKSCGCLHIETITTHGMSRTRLSQIWRDMKQRCQNVNNASYESYGGRGIAVCDEWQEFVPFYNWAVANGYNDTLTIDRIDNDKGYSPDNCRWATQKEQANNRHSNNLITFMGETLTLTQWSEKTGMGCQTLYERIFIRGWSIEKALTQSTE